MSKPNLKLAVFVSGRGSNLEAIVHAQKHGELHADVCAVLSSKPDAPALDFAERHAIPGYTIPPRQTGEQERVDFILQRLVECGANFIALAGYMHLVEPQVVAAYHNRIVNIHPALLPAFGGKGMYGSHVHEAVIASGVRLSGATVHIVDEVYDRGAIVMQRAVPVLPYDTPGDLAARVLKAEHSLYPEVLQLFAEDRVSVEGTITKITGPLPNIV